MGNIKSLEKLIGSFMMLPGVGYKTAQRYAYSILASDREKVQTLAESMMAAKDNIKFCNRCGNFSEEDFCDICKNRSSDIVCVVKEPKDVVALEKVRNLNCLYHVLHGCINPMEGRSAEDIKLKELLIRVNLEDIKEVIVATNPDVEGEATALYIAKILKPLNIKVTRLAQGISMGSELEYADEVTLTKAIEARKDL